MKKKFLVGSCRFFVSDIISGGLLGYLGQFHLALGLNRSTIFSYNPSLLILLMTCWGFGFKGYGLKQGYSTTFNKGPVSKVPSLPRSDNSGEKF